MHHGCPSKGCGGSSFLPGVSIHRCGSSSSSSSDFSLSHAPRVSLVLAVVLMALDDTWHVDRPAALRRQLTMPSMVFVVFSRCLEKIGMLCSMHRPSVGCICTYLSLLIVVLLMWLGVQRHVGKGAKFENQIYL